MTHFLDPIEDSEMSEEFWYLAGEGVVIVNVYRAMKGTMVVVSSREVFERTCHLVHWYARMREMGAIVTVNMDRWVDRGQITFLLAG